MKVITEHCPSVNSDRIRFEKAALGQKCYDLPHDDDCFAGPAQPHGGCPSIGHLDPPPVDVEAAARWAELRVRLVEVGRFMNVNDLWIAAIAAASQMPIVTQDNVTKDSDFAALKAIGGPEVLPV